MNICFVSEGHAGHTNQSLGLVEAISRHRPVNAEQLNVESKIRGWLRSLMISYFRYGWYVPEAVIGFIYSSFQYPQKKPDVIISSGGKGIFFARYLTKKYKAKLVYCGSPGRYPIDWFDVILSPIAIPKHPQVILTETLITRMTPQTVAKEAANCSLRGSKGITSKVGTVLIGGESRSHIFRDDDWLELAKSLNELFLRDGWQWLISTSPRTGVRAESILRNELKAESLVDTVWWSERPRKVVSQYLGLADVIIVTEDSLTMVSEAVCSGKPVVTIHAKQTKGSDYLRPILARLSAAHRLRSICTDELGRLEEIVQGLQPIDESMGDNYALDTLHYLER